MSGRRKADDDVRTTAAEVKEARQRMSETVEGGRYRRSDGSYVDAWGEPVNDSKTASKADD